MPYRALLEKHLAQAEEFIRGGEERVAAQKQFIEGMEKAGRNTELAVAVLHLMERSQRLHEADRDRLRTALATFPAFPKSFDDESALR